MAKKKSKKKKSTPKVMLYSETQSTYVIKDVLFKELLKFPEGFDLVDVEVSCKNRTGTLQGERRTTKTEGNVTSVTSEAIEQTVTEAEIRKLLGLSKDEEITDVVAWSEEIRIETNREYSGPYKA